MQPTESAIEKAIRLADGMTSLVRKLNERGHDIKGHATIYQWKQSRVPADYCPDIEVITGVKCEELRADVNWAVLRDTKKHLPELTDTPKPFAIGEGLRGATVRVWQKDDTAKA